jgi:hypothetical protein
MTKKPVILSLLCAESFFSQLSVKILHFVQDDKKPRIATPLCQANKSGSLESKWQNGSQ